MNRDDRELLICLLLADVSQQQRQYPGRDRLLLIAGAAACRAGRLEVAARCRQAVLDHNPAHLVGRFDSIPDALRHADFQSLFKQLRRQCPLERAEHLLAIQGLADQVPIDESIDVGQLIDEIFSREHWPNVPGSE